MSSSVLRERLRELVAAGFVETDDAGHYGLTGSGQELWATMQPLVRWADEWGKGRRDDDGDLASHEQD